ncbi:MAG: hypothetical protein FJ387_08240 [Verrucomicrobia bacterium]|nr:hypothetical protein [Verrucomicrobiota bacterium]
MISPRLLLQSQHRVALLCLLAGGLDQAAAQPRIILQPGNAAVQVGQNAQFTVTGTGTAPLAYQWRFNGDELPGATDRTLAVTNAALPQLGRYVVVVSNSAGAVTSAPAWLLLATRWTELVYFGASEGLQRCDGPPWTDLLANRLGVRLRNYAEGGADSSEVRSQIAGYLRTLTPTTNTLISLWTGGAGIDVKNGLPMEQAVSNRLANLRLLAEAGARHILLPTFLPPERLPAFQKYPHMTTELFREFDRLVDEGLESLQAEYSLSFYRTDMWLLFNAIWQDPAAYGFRVPPPGSETFGSDIYCDGGHKSAAAHRHVAEHLYRSLTPPLRIDSFGRTSDGGLRLDWSGGSPPFRVERTTDLASGRWEPVGEVSFLPSATFERETATEFFRALFLGQ